MLSAALLGVLLIPVCYVAVRRLMGDELDEPDHTKSGGAAPGGGAVVGAAQQRGTRRAVLAELVRGRKRGEEELTPLRGDPLAAAPLVGVTAALLAQPRVWRLFAGSAVANYALTPQAWDLIASRE